jgi:hypothetical protein
MGNGIFREPFMYGQDYNPMLEALIAAPFLRIGADPWFVLPVVTSVLALLPFISWAFWHWRRDEHIAALLFAGMPLLLPVEWGLSTTMARGMVQGLALLAPLPWLSCIRGSMVRNFLSSLFITTALLCNPNAFILLVVVHRDVLILEWRNIRSLVAFLSGAIPAVIYWYHGRHFFDAHPWDIVHTIDAEELNWHRDLFLKGLSDLDLHFKGLAPIWSAHGQASIWFLLIGAFLLLRQNKRANALLALLALCIMLCVLGTGKAHNGCASVFFPLSRAFLAVPMIVAWCAAELSSHIALKGSVVKALVFLVLIATAVKSLTIRPILERELDAQACGLSPEESLELIFARCKAIGAAAQASGAEVIVPIRWPDLRTDPAAHFQVYFNCYACSFVVPDLPPTFGPGYDRRSWVHDRYAHSPAGNVLFVGGDHAAWARAIMKDPTIVRVGNEHLSLHALRCDSLTIDTLSIRLGVDDHILR